MDETDELRRHIAVLEAEVEALGNELAGVQSTRGWRMLQGVYYRPLARAREALARIGGGGERRGSAAHRLHAGGLFVGARGRIGGHRKTETRASPESLGYRPVVSMLVPVTRHDPPGLLARTARSLTAQLYDRWELVVAVHPDDLEFVEARLPRRHRKDARIRFAAAPRYAVEADLLGAALESSTGEAVCASHPGNIWTPAGLLVLVAELNREARPVMVYGDELVETRGAGTRWFAKPAWSPEYFLGTGYVGEAFIVDRTALDQVGGFRREYHPAQREDLILRLSEQGVRIAHAPEVVEVSSRTAGCRAGQSAARRRAVEAALARRGEAASVSDAVNGIVNVRRALNGHARVSVIVPFRDGAENLRRCVGAVMQRTDYRDLEILLVDNDSRTEAMASYLETLRDNERVRMVRVSRPFNFSELCNRGAAEATGGYLLFLNDDTEATCAGWLTALMEQGQRREVGAVGGKLIYPNNRIQHAGIAFGHGDSSLPLPIHAYRHARRSAAGDFATLSVPREVSAVTGACMLTRKTLFEEVGGFDAEHLPVEYNDIDYCLKLRSRGYAIIFTPHAELYHMERQTRGRTEVEQKAAERLRERWGTAFSEELYTRVGADR